MSRIIRDGTVLTVDDKEIARLDGGDGVETLCAPLWAANDTWPAIPWTGDCDELERYLRAHPFACRECLGTLVEAVGYWYRMSGRFYSDAERSDAKRKADEWMASTAFWREMSAYEKPATSVGGP